MKLDEFIKTTDLERGLLIGYYGGGNYGDELLLEILQNLLQRKGVRDFVVAYQHPEAFTRLHHDLGFRRVNVFRKLSLLGAVLKSKRIIIGGGGLWGVDMNFNTFLMSLLLFLSRWLLGKKVYLLGVGYYDSTTRLGRAGAQLAGKAANLVLARDEESLQNFGRINPHTYLDRDIAMYSSLIDPMLYARDVAELEETLPIHGKTLFITLRRKQNRRASSEQSFVQLIAQTLAGNQDKPAIIAPLELEHINPHDYARGRQWQKRYGQVRLLEHQPNPLALFFYLRKHRHEIVLIGPQFHIIISAYLNDIPFLPLMYDNKVTQLFNIIKLPESERVSLSELNESVIQAFIDMQWGSE